MVLNRCAIYQYIIKENKYKLSQKLLKYLVHHSLECGWGISEPKWHHRELIVALMSPECCFLCVGRVDSNLVES